MAYEVMVLPAVARTVARLPAKMRARIANRLLVLADQPRGAGTIKLSGEEAYRTRVGDYRIIYTIEDRRLIVVIIDVGHRRDVYRR